jgi:hypothetical protein
VDFNETDRQLMFRYSTIVRYYRKNGSIMGQCTSNSGGREVLYNNLTESSIPMELVGLIKMCLKNLQ